MRPWSLICGGSSHPGQEVPRLRDPTLTLGLIVLVRTGLGFSLEVELDGVMPWRRKRPELFGSGIKH